MLYHFFFPFPPCRRCPSCFLVLGALPRGSDRLRLTPGLEVAFAGRPTRKIPCTGCRACDEDETERVGGRRSGAPSTLEVPVGVVAGWECRVVWLASWRWLQRSLLVLPMGGAWPEVADLSKAGLGNAPDDFAFTTPRAAGSSLELLRALIGGVGAWLTTPPQSDPLDRDFAGSRGLTSNDADLEFGIGRAVSFDA